MWTCPNCETKNEENICIICGAYQPAEPEYTPPVPPSGAVYGAPVPPPPPVKIKKKKKWPIVLLVVLIFMVLLVTFSVGFVEIMYRNAYTAMENGNYDKAVSTFNAISFYRDSEQLLDECDYLLAQDYLKENNAVAARPIFERLGNYKKCKEFLVECDYQDAIKLIDDRKLFEAYDAFKNLGDYGESQSKLEYVKELIYDEGVSCYRSGNYSEAKNHFDKSYDVNREDDYYVLINAHNEKASVSDLKNLAGFEDANKLLLTDYYLTDFLMGRWSGSGDYLDFYKNNNGGTTVSFSLPTSVNGPNWKIVSGVLKMGNDSIGWTDTWRFEIIDKNYIKVYAFSNSATYNLKR